MKPSEIFKLIPLLVLSTLALILNSCGLVEEPTTTVSCSGVCSSQTKQTGVFVDSAVAGVTFRTTSGFSGTTNSAGEFNYVAGDTASFSIGDVDLGSVTASSVLTPVEVMGASDTADQRVINLARLLQTLDSDGDPTNGINISSGTSNALKGKSVNFNVSVNDFTNDSTVAQIQTAVGRSLKSASDALNHLQNTMGSRGLSGKVASNDKLKGLVPDYEPPDNQSSGTGSNSSLSSWSLDLGVYASDIAVDSDNNTYVSGTTSGDLNGISGLGQSDYFLIKLDSDGNKLWTKLIGTSDVEIGGGDLVIDNESNVYLSGHSRGVIGANNCTGPFTGGANGNNFLIKFNGDGDQIWYKNLCTLNAVSRYESFLKVDPNTNDIILSGSHMSSLGDFDSLGLNYGNDDIYIIRFSQIGTKLSSNLLGGSGHDNVYDMEIDEYGAIYLTGMTGSNLSGANPGGPSSGVWYQDGFLMKLSSSGSLIWTQQDTIFNSNYSNKIKYTNDRKILQLRYAYDGTQSNQFLRTFDLDGSILNEIEVSNSIRNIYYNDFIYLSNGKKYDSILSEITSKNLQFNSEFIVREDELVYGINSTMVTKTKY